MRYTGRFANMISIQTTGGGKQIRVRTNTKGEQENCHLMIQKIISLKRIISFSSECSFLLQPNSFLAINTLTLNMAAACSFEMLVSTSNGASCYKPEDHNFNSYRRGKFKTYIK